MSQRLVYFNGKMVPEAEAKISIYDSALMFGDMVFEMTRSFNKKQFKLREHLERLYTSIKYVHIPLEMTIDEMEAPLSQLKFELKSSSPLLEAPTESLKAMYLLRQLCVERRRVPRDVFGLNNSQAFVDASAPQAAYSHQSYLYSHDSLSEFTLKSPRL